jgi:L-threonylcarbamoyladenylate synthase
MEIPEQVIDEAVNVISKGGVVAFPTDTVYCLGADIYNYEALAKIYRVKARPRDMALPVIVADMEQLKQVCSVTPLGLFLAKEFFPVGFTLVMPRLPNLPDIVTAGKDTVAVRIQDHPVAAEIVKKFGRGVAGTSANVHGMKSPVTGAEVREQLGENVDLIIEGTCQGGVESTIVDATGERPMILREGAVPAQKVQEAYMRFLELSQR